MSQIIQSLASGPVPPSVATEYDTDVNSPAVPAANILNVVGGATTANNANGIRTDGSSGGNTLTVQLTNRISGSGTTVDAATADLITLALGATPGVYTFDISIAGFTTAGGTLGAGYTIVGSVRTTGAAAALLPSQAIDAFEEGALSAGSAVLTFSGNNAIIRVTGTLGYTINWNASGSFVFVS